MTPKTGAGGDKNDPAQPTVIIVNFKHEKSLDSLQDRLSMPAIYVGRANPHYGLEASLLGNPFKLKRKSQTAEVLQKYKAWLWDKIKTSKEMEAYVELLYRLSIGGGVALVCWCHPDPCHADVIKACINWMHVQKGGEVTKSVQEAPRQLDLFSRQAMPALTRNPYMEK